MKIIILSDTDWEQLYKEVGAEQYFDYPKDGQQLIIRTILKDGIYYTNEYENEMVMKLTGKAI